MEKLLFFIKIMVVTPCRARICKRWRRTGIDPKEYISPGWESIPGLLAKFTNTGSVVWAFFLPWCKRLQAHFLQSKWKVYKSDLFRSPLRHNQGPASGPVTQVTRPVVVFLVHDWGMELALASGCRSVTPSYVGWRAGTTTVARIPQSGTKKWPPEWPSDTVFLKFLCTGGHIMYLTVSSSFLISFVMGGGGERPEQVD